MAELFLPQVGAVFSADIAVPEREREVRFYSRVLTTGENPLWREDLMNNAGWPIIGLGARTPEYADLPLQWMPHIQVADVAASAQRASDLGGRVLVHSRDDDGRSQWAVLSDPNGAAFGVVPVVAEDAVLKRDDSDAPVGRIAWLDLTVPDAAATRDFYREVIGWTTQDVAMEDGGEQYADYAMVGSEGAGCAGVCSARGQNARLPPVWMIYLPVNDLEESLRRVPDEGGTVVKTYPGEDGKPMYAAVRDPVGAHFGLLAG
ncbi:MAG: VOC family protein [Hyphomicrobiales bacterium]